MLSLKEEEKDVFWFDELGVKYTKDKKTLLKGVNHLKKYEIISGCTKIADRAFDRVNIQNIIIPESVTHIGEYAFYFNNILDIKIPDNVQFIGKGAFERCPLKEIILPSKLTKIESCVFKHCENLIKIIIPESVKEIGERAFYKCTALKVLKIPSSIHHFGGAFINGCNNLKELYINNEFIKIHNGYLFIQENKIISSIIYGTCSITIPENIRIIGDGAFSETANDLFNIKLHNKIISIEDWAFYNCNGLMQIEIPDSVTHIGKGAFLRCRNLIEIEIPSNLKILRERTFQYCSQLKKVHLPYGITRIEDYAFSDCQELEEINLPDSIEYIGKYSISGKQIDNLIIPNAIKFIDKDAFMNSIKRLYIKSNNPKLILNRCLLPTYIPLKFEEGGLEYSNNSEIIIVSV